MYFCSTEEGMEVQEHHLKLYGMRLDLDKTPHDYSITADDVVIVAPNDPILVQTPSEPHRAACSTAKENLILLKVQSKKHGKKKFKIKKVCVAAPTSPPELASSNNESQWPKAARAGRACLKLAKPWIRLNLNFGGASKLRIGCINTVAWRLLWRRNSQQPRATGAVWPWLSELPLTNMVIAFSGVTTVLCCCLMCRCCKD
jgi:hypothetical protein